MKSSLTQLVIAALVLSGAVGAYVYWYSSVVSDEQEVASLSSQIVDAKQNAARLAAAQMALNDVASTETLVESYFISEATIAPFLSQLQALGKAASTTVTIQSVSADPANHALSIALTINGTFDSVMRTEGVIEHAPYDLANRGFSVSESADPTTHVVSWSATSVFSVGTSLATSTSFTAPPAPAPAPAPILNTGA